MPPICKAEKTLLLVLKDVLSVNKNGIKKAGLFTGFLAYLQKEISTRSLPVWIKLLYTTPFPASLFPVCYLSFRFLTQYYIVLLCFRKVLLRFTGKSLFVSLEKFPVSIAHGFCAHHNRKF